MARPEFPTGCIMPVDMIRSIRQEQEYYDEDPERYEREERYAEARREEERQQEREEQYEQDRLAYEQSQQE